jgi:Tol biopolymer transport system component
MNANGNHRRALSMPAGLFAHDPSWSPDSSRMAFSASPPGTTNLGIYVLDIKAGTVRQLTSPADPGQPGDATPAWRPLAP